MEISRIALVLVEIPTHSMPNSSLNFTVSNPFSEESDKIYSCPLVVYLFLYSIKLSLT